MLRWALYYLRHASLHGDICRFGRGIGRAGVMVLRVRLAADQPLSEVRIGTAGDGSTEFTDATGHARLRLAAQAKPGSRIALRIVDPPHFVFISPWDGWVVAPSFDNDSGNYVRLRLS